MPYSVEPTAVLSLLPRADGSATFSQNGYTVTGAVNGPIEVQRRDELPEEAVIDVLVRPAAGVGGLISVSCSSMYSNSLGIRYKGATSRINPAIDPSAYHLDP
jgi:exosome complex component RRP46